MVAIADLERAAVLTDDVAVFREAALRHLAAVGTLDILTFAEQKGLLKFDRGELRDLLWQCGEPSKTARERNLELQRN